VFGFSRTFATSLAASITKRVECEKCRCTYFYHLARPYATKRARTTTRAEARAELRAWLKHESEPVPCPKCGWIQAYMVRELLRASHPWMSWLGKAIFIVTFTLLGGLLLGLSIARPDRVKPALPYFGAAALVASAAGGALLARRHVLTQRIDPNRDYPQHPRPIPGAPPPLLPAGPPDESGAVMLVCARPVEPDFEDDWLAWQLADRFVRVCCVCSGDHEREFATPVDSPRNLRVPLCTRCYRIIALKWWGWALGSIVAGIALAGLVAKLVPALDDLSRAILWAGLGLSISVSTVMTIPRLLVLPYRMRMLDPRRLVVRLKFVNAEYTRRLGERIRQAGPAHPHGALA
jgi:hypothetical protein